MEISWQITDNFRLASPLIAIGAGLVFLFLWRFFTRRTETVKHSHLELLAKDKFRQKVAAKWIFIFPFLAMVFLIIVLAQPQIIETKEEIISARDIVLILDESGSMRIVFNPFANPNDLLPDDFQKTRLGMAEKWAVHFIGLRKREDWQNDRLAVIFYDDEARIVRKFNNDLDQIESAFFSGQENIFQIKDEDAGEVLGYFGGTNTANALYLARNYFQRVSNSKNKVIILTTDFDDEPFEMIEAVRKLKDAGIKIYLLGIDTDRIQPRLGEFKEYLQDEDMRIFGIYRESDWSEAYQLIDALEKSEMKTVVSASQNLGWIFVVPAILNVIIFICLSETFKKIP